MCHTVYISPQVLSYAATLLSEYPNTSIASCQSLKIQFLELFTDLKITTRFPKFLQYRIYWNSFLALIYGTNNPFFGWFSSESFLIQWNRFGRIWDFSVFEFDGKTNALFTEVLLGTRRTRAHTERQKIFLGRDFILPINRHFRSSTNDFTIIT